MTEPEPSTNIENAAMPAMSLGARLGNVFVAPSEVFDEVKVSPPNMANWIVPTIIAIVIGIIYTMVVFSQPAVMQQMREPMERKMQQLVDSGKLTRQQADQQMEITGKFMTPTVFKVFGILGSLFIQPTILFFVALIIWLIGRYGFHSHFEYMKGVEVIGLSMMIAVPGTIVAMLLAVIYGNVAITPGPVLLVSHFDSLNRLHRILSALNVMSFWYMAVVSIGLSRLSGTSLLKSAIWIFAIWAVLTLGPILAFGGK